MTKKQRIKFQFTRFRRVMITMSLVILAVAIVGVVAYKSSIRTEIKIDDDNVQVSAPTTITFIMPIENGTITKDFSNTALKFNSTLKQWESHKAVDIKGENGADVMAVYDGEIVSVESTYLKGTTVTIKHNNSLQTSYSSLDNVTVKQGDKVKQGTVIGKASTSAKSESNDGDHLHLEVYLDKVKVDPLLYLNTGDK